MAASNELFGSVKAGPFRSDPARFCCVQCSDFFSDKGLLSTSRRKPRATTVAYNVLIVSEIPLILERKFLILGTGVFIRYFMAVGEIIFTPNDTYSF